MRVAHHRTSIMAAPRELSHPIIVSSKIWWKHIPDTLSLLHSVAVLCEMCSPLKIPASSPGNKSRMRSDGKGRKEEVGEGDNLNLSQS